MPITYARDEIPTEDELAALYDSVDWTAYTKNPAMLRQAVSSSATLVTARDGERLVGLARVLSDGLTIVYLQDILVDPRRHRTGIGRELMLRVLAPYEHVRQKVLITDGDPAQLAFYESMGFVLAEENDPPVRAFVRFA